MFLWNLDVQGREGKPTRFETHRTSRINVCVACDAFDDILHVYLGSPSSKRSVLVEIGVQ